MPTVSVIVPNYNHARFLRQRIDSILAQTYQDFELILLDDCSTDDSRSTLREYAPDPRIAHLEFNEKNSGSPFAQWNKGVRLARGKYVWIAESDDYADARLLERLVGLLDNHPNTALAYCRSWCAADSGRLIGFADGYVPWWDPEGWTVDWCMTGRQACRKYFCGTNRIPNASAAVFRRDAFERAGAADETLRLCGDWKLWAAMALEGEVEYTAEPLNYFRHHNITQREQVRLADAAIEHLAVSAWVLDRVPTPEPDVLRTVYLAHATVWVPAVASPGIPRGKKQQIVRLVQVVDPHPMRTAARFAPLWARISIARQFAKLWYPILDFTYDTRHSVGLTRDGLAQIKVKFGR